VAEGLQARACGSHDYARGKPTNLRLKPGRHWVATLRIIVLGYLVLVVIFSRRGLVPDAPVAGLAALVACREEVAAPGAPPADL
jgi:hypothetical protein